MTEVSTNHMTETDLANLGEGHIAYMRRMSSDEIIQRFPVGDQIQPGLDIWALFGADGTPLAVSDDPGSILQSASQNSLETVSLH
ncbi:DUF1150 domain-containing protein [Fulvimarina endophytica]|uniref:DUF1150 domain-containing protein n=1 Tax=Fulvimarina endophytica TaxID=2293836 RepID=A0A371X0P8_9HYPH|nr:DUF1150 domain-containing protein [Fulvimarina endophytica]RFC62818.1 DUF1150 domain-containing protein [Fulvimarina endophytica]